MKLPEKNEGAQKVIVKNAQQFSKTMRKMVGSDPSKILLNCFFLSVLVRLEIIANKIN